MVGVTHMTQFKKLENYEGATVQAPDSSVAEAITMMAQILSELKAKGTGDDRLETLSRGVEALVSAEASRPRENLNFPNISTLNPKGERDNPRPALKCKMFWVGFKMAPDSLTYEEINLLNRVVPGAYRVTKSDGKSVPFTVGATQDMAGRLEKMTFRFPCKNTEDRMNHMPMTSYLREVLGDTLPKVEQLIEQVKALQAELAAKSA